MILVAKDFIENIKNLDTVWDIHSHRWVLVIRTFDNNHEIELDCGGFTISAEVGHSMFRQLRSEEVS